MVLMARNLEIQSDSGGYHINMPETHQFLDTDINKIENVVETKCDEMMPRINVLQDIVIPLEQNIDINTEINDGHTLRESQSANEVETVTEVPNQSQLLTKKGYPRKRKTNTIKKCERKKLKLQEKRQAYALKECTSCTNECIRKCKDKITENRRQQINNEFWKMSWSEQRIFIVCQCQRQIPKKHTESSSRANTYFYYLKNEEGTSAQVCKPFFLTTLGFKYNNDTVLQNALKNSQNHLLSTKRDMRDIQPNCEKCEEQTGHLEKVKKARAAYQKDKFQKDQKMMCYSVDLQKVIMLPRMDQYKIVLFTPRIVIFNESFVPVGEQKHLNAVAAIWHEGIAGRKKEDIISSFHAFFLKNRDAQTVTLWLDNCSAQNKNWCMLSFLTYIVNSSEIAANKIHLKYFQAGHTFMSADSFHHQVELSMKKSGNIYDFNDFHEAVQRANSGKVDVISMTPSHFSDWKDFSSQYKLKKTKPRAYLNNMVMASFTRGEHTFVYYNDFDGVGHKLSFLQAQIEKPLNRNRPREILQSKKDTILEKLCPLMPANRIKFWNELEGNTNITDLNVPLE
ncbi:hypothetical protein JTB14_032940 [Gonioctena quinquepunctata]|nr:hypothetical protein JTB14_032940 [Gonioctena quinquepunctata]